MSHSCIRCGLMTGLTCLVVSTVAAQVDEADLRKPYEAGIKHFNARRYADARKEFARVIEQAEKIKKGDKLFPRAQEFLKNARDLQVRSYEASASYNRHEGSQAAHAARLQDALRSWQQALEDLTELEKLFPKKSEVGGERKRMTARVKQGQVLQGLFAGKLPEAGPLRDAVPAVPEPLHQVAPPFSVPLSDQLKMFTLSGVPDQGIVVIQYARIDFPGAALAAESLRHLRRSFGDQGVSVLTVHGGKPADLKKFVQDHRPDWPVAINDLGDFQKHYLEGHSKNNTLPIFLVITRDRRVLWLSGDDPVETCAALLRVVAEEVKRPAGVRPKGALPFYAKAEAITALPLKGAPAQSLQFGARPAMVLITVATDRNPYLKSLAEVHKQHGAKLEVMAVVLASDIAKVEAFAKDKTYPVFWAKTDPPACYGAPSSLALVTGNGRVLKTFPLYTADLYGPILDFYARVLTTPGGLPAELEKPARANLAHRNNGGRIELASAAPSAAETLIDGRSGKATWTSSDKQPEIVLSFLDQGPAEFDRVVLDARSAIQDVEILAGNDGPSGAFRTLGTFRLDNRRGLQALPVAATRAKYVKVRLLSTLAADSFGLGEILVEEAADARPSLADRLSAAFARGFRDEFAQGRLTFWQQLDFLAGYPGQSAIEQGRLVLSGGRHGGDYRATAWLHSALVNGDYRFEAVIRPRARAAGLIAGFQDWDNFDRVLVLGSPLQGDPDANSIRLERWRNGKAQVLSVHGEWFTHEQDIRLEIIRQGKSLAVKAQGKLIMHVAAEEAGEPRRVGLFAADSSCAFKDVTFAPLTAPLDLPDMPALSTASGASIVYVSSQGTSKERQAWASNLLRVPALGRPGGWEASAQDGQAPEVVFAFKDRREVVIEELGFALPPAKGAATQNLARKVEVLVSRGTSLNPAAFQSLGTFDLVAKEGLQRFTLKGSAACRFLMLRLLENSGGNRYALAQFTVRLAKETGKLSAVVDPGRLDKDFTEPAGAREQEPNDTLAQATPLAAGKELEAQIRAGEVDYFQLPEPPATKGRAFLHLQVKALPWLRLNAEVLNEKGGVLAPPLVRSATGQSVRQIRRGTPLPRYLRVQMPESSLSLVVDTSGSMEGREKDVRAAVQGFLQGVSAKEEIEVLRFGTKVTTLMPFTKDQKKLASVAAKISMGGSTALYQALLQSLESLSTREGNAAIVLLSDGMNTVSGVDFADLCRRLRRQPVPIYVIGVGWDLYEYDAVSGNTCVDLLRNLALQTGGRFYFAPRSEELAELYRRIAAELRGETRYRVTATWQVSDLATELAEIKRPERDVQPLLSLLPPALMEVEDVGSASKPGPHSAGLPPLPAELGVIPPPKVELTVTKPPLPLPLELSELRPDRRPRLSFRPQLPASVELAPDPARDRPLGPLALAPIPEFGRLGVRYQAASKKTTVLPPTVRPAFELILDSSGSMKELVGKEAKYLAARRVMHELVEAMPEDANVGLRLFGYMGFHDPRKEPREPPATDKRYDTDSDVVVSIGPLNLKDRRKLIKEWIDYATPRGKTPLVYSLLQALKDFPAEWKGPKTVILISDGMETCGGKLEDLARAYGGTDIGLVVHVVGFDVREPEEVKQLQAIARIGRGNFYNAADARQLAAALRDALERVRFVVHDASGKSVVAQGFVNGPGLDLEPGSYRISIPGTRLQAVTIDVRGGGVAGLSLDEAGKLVPLSKDAP